MYWDSLESAILNGHGIERQFICHVHDDSNPSASINSMTGWWVCYACHASGKIDLENVEFDPYSLRRQVQMVRELIERSVTIYPKSWLATTNALGPGEYWLSRFTPEICQYHQLGQTANGSAATIPLWGNNGDLYGVIKRDLTGHDQKYRYPYSVKLSTMLFNYHRNTSGLVVLTEGATDAIAFDEICKGYAMAMYGAGLSYAQTQLLKRYDPSIVVVATDQDKAGESAFRTVSQRLRGDCPVVRLEWDSYKDLASIPLEERRELVDYTVATYGVAS